MIAIAGLGAVASGCVDQSEEADRALEQLDEAQKEFNKGLDDAAKQTPKDSQLRKRLKEARKRANAQIEQAEREAREQSD
jgi:hypothetical protein